MKYLIVILVLLLGITACSTFTENVREIRRACKSGVSKYDDGTINFECEKLK